MPEKSIKTVHNIVYSVKGGCGKTSFSLYLAYSNLYFCSDDKMLYLKGVTRRKECGKEIVSGHKVANYMLDMDFLGTTLMESAGLVGERSLVTMPNLIFDDQKIWDLGRYNRIGAMDDEKYIIYSAYRETDKERFHVKRKNTPLLRYDDFRYEIGNIQKDIGQHAAFKNKASGDGNLAQINLIYDMPPNADGYTDAFLDEITDKLRRESEKNGENEKVVLYLLSNSVSTFNCNIEWLKRFVSVRNPVGLMCVMVNCENLNGNDGGDGLDWKKLAQSMVSEISDDGSMLFYYYDFAFWAGIHEFNNNLSDSKASALGSLFSGGASYGAIEKIERNAARAR